MEKRSSTCATFDFAVNCQSHTLEEVLGFMRTKGLLKKWAFQKEDGDGNDGEGEHYRCKISLRKSETNASGKLRIDPMTKRIRKYLHHADKIIPSPAPLEWEYVTDEEKRIPGGGPWTSWTKGPIEGESTPRKPRIVIKATVAKTKENEAMHPEVVTVKPKNVTVLVKKISPTSGKDETVMSTIATPMRTELTLDRESKEKPPVFGARKTFAAKKTIEADDATIIAAVISTGKISGDIVVDDEMRGWYKCYYLPRMEERRRNARARGEMN